MAVYRYQVVSASMWRGTPKRFNNTFHAASNYRTASLHSVMQYLGYKEDGDTVGACSGGVASITVYDVLGGPPVAQQVYFDWSAPATWIPYDGTGWGSVPEGTPVDASGESAMILWAKLPGVSATGKPMSVRKYLHAVPSRSAAEYSDPDISSADIAAMELFVPDYLMLSPSGSQGSPNTIEPYYGNHQRVRGRRRTTKQVVGQSFSAGVVLGTTTPGSGGLPFQNQ